MGGADGASGVRGAPEQCGPEQGRRSGADDGEENFFKVFAAMVESARCNVPSAGMMAMGW
jgi:hypothetical protein